MKTFATAVIGLALAATTAWITPDDPPKVADGEYQPVASLDALMVGHGMASGKIRKSLADTANDRRWRDIQLNAELLAELGNVNVSWGRRDDYKDWARELRDTALGMAAEAKKRGEMDDDVLRAAYEKIDATCSACHEVYK